MANLGDLSGLYNFSKRLKSVNDYTKIAPKIVEKLCTYGKEYAESLYAGSADQNNNNPISVEYEISNNNAKIIANGTQIAYLEFGTGEKGVGTYNGKIPDIQFNFYSSRLGTNVQLNGWTYSYANYLDPTIPVWNGFQAEAQMWKTSQYLRRIIPQVVREVVASEKIS
jgi:hypothetical protein